MLVYVVDERWRAMKAISEEQLRQLKMLVDNLAKFKETHNNLTAWLAQKDKMVSVLGPLATEPNMVSTQLQQVQVSRI